MIIYRQNTMVWSNVTAEPCLYDNCDGKESTKTNDSKVYPGDDYTDYDEHIAGIYLWRFLPPIMLILGTIGSFLSILVLNRKPIRISVCTVYLTGLAISDLFVLNTGLLRNWILYTFDVDVRELSVSGCKIHLWTLYSALHFSAWMLVFVTIDRVGLTYSPIKFKIFFTKMKAIAITFITGVVLLLFNGHMLVGIADMTKYDGNKTEIFHSCTYLTDEYEYFFNYIWSWLDFCVYCALPSIILVVGNVMIIAKVIASKRNLARTGPVTNQTQQNNRITSMTVTMVSLNTVFLLSTTPISIYIIYYNKWYQEARSHYDLAVLSLLWPVTNILMYTNNTINFGLYIFSGKKFRKEVIKLFQRGEERNIIGHNVN